MYKHGDKKGLKRIFNVYSDKRHNPYRRGGGESPVTLDTRLKPGLRWAAWAAKINEMIKQKPIRAF